MESVKVFKIVEEIPWTGDQYIRVARAIKPHVAVNKGDLSPESVIRDDVYRIRRYGKWNRETEKGTEFRYVIMDPDIEQMISNLEAHTDSTMQLWKEAIQLVHRASFKDRLRYLFTRVLSRGDV